MKLKKNIFLNNSLNLVSLIIICKSTHYFIFCRNKRPKITFDAKNSENIKLSEYSHDSSNYISSFSVDNIESMYLTTGEKKKEDSL